MAGILRHRNSERMVSFECFIEKKKEKNRHATHHLHRPRQAHPNVGNNNPQNPNIDNEEYNTSHEQSRDEGGNSQELEVVSLMEP